MSKASELRLIRGQRSADAAINYRHRSGDSEGSGGSMLDFYAQEESAEEAYIEEQEESAREVFSRAFRLYLKKTLTGKERKFLSRVLSGKEKPQEVGRALGVKWFEYMQEIRRKAFNNAEAFGRVVQLSGWSRAEIFAGAVFGRLKELERRGRSEELPREKKQAQARAMMKAFRESSEAEKRTAHNFCVRRYQKEHAESWKKYQSEYNKKYKKEHREEIQARKRAYYHANIEREREKRRERRARNAEKETERNRKWREENREKVRESCRAYCKANAEKVKEMQRAYRAANLEKVRKYQREYAARQRAKKKAEKEAAKALAGLLLLSQTQGAETSENVSTME